jgi:hypothetical protein
VVRRGVQRAVARVEYRVVHAPALEQRAFGLPLAAIVVAAQQEQSLACADLCLDDDRWTSILLV